MKVGKLSRARQRRGSRRPDAVRRRLLALGAGVYAARSVAAEPLRRRTSPSAPPARPAYLQSLHEKSSAATIVRVTADPGESVHGEEVLWSAPARHAYSTVAAWDAADELLAIRNAGANKPDGTGAREWLLLDRKGYEIKGTIDRDFVGFRWWHRRPGRMLMTTAQNLVDHEPLSGDERPFASSTALFEDFADLSFANEGNLSADDASVALVGTRRADNVVCAVLWSLDDDEHVMTVPLDHPRVDFATVSPSGRYLVVNGELEPGAPDRTRVLDLDGEPIGPVWEPYGTPSHYDLALDAEGEDIAVGVAKTATARVRAGSVIARHLRTGEITTLLEGGYPTHVSCRNTALPGWCFVSCTGRPEKYPRFGDELVAVRTDGSGEFRRICRFRQVEAGYWAQPQACPDTRGRRAVFASNWGDADGPVQAYVVETGLSGR